MRINQAILANSISKLSNTISDMRIILRNKVYFCAVTNLQNNMSIHILAIESSCDDTSVAILRDGEIRSNIVSSQQVHSTWGGVVPELASRAHLQNIIPTVHTALSKADVSLSEINAIACTLGPGLIGSLLVGVNVAKSLAQALRLPFITVNHMQAHVLAHFIDNPKPEFPFLCLVVSGGHTQLVIVHSYTTMELIGETLDDAAGEAFDKLAKILQLPYPGGPLIDKLAENGDELKFEFAKPTIAQYDFSFSGLKTSVLYFIKNKLAENPRFIEENKHDLCASIRKTIVDVLLRKLKKAAFDKNIKHVAICGGVSANTLLRKEFEALGKKHGWITYIPKFEYCTDNAGMIAIAGYFKYISNDFDSLEVKPRARFSISEK